MPIETIKKTLAEKQHKAAETKCRTVLMMLARRVEHLHQKATESPADFLQAYHSANKLLKKLKNQQEQYFDKQAINGEAFVANCKSLINKEKETLEKIHSWPSLLTFVDFVVKEISLTKTTSLNYPHLERDARLFKPEQPKNTTKTNHPKFGS